MRLCRDNGPIRMRAFTRRTGNIFSALVVAVALGAVAWPAHAQGRQQTGTAPPLVQSPPAATRIAQISIHAREVIAELDGKARGARLFAAVAAIERRGRVGHVRFALELQSVLHVQRGNYLWALYATLGRHDQEKALAWAHRLVDLGVAVSITSGGFPNLEHLDPSAPLPRVRDPQLARIPMSRWVDRFASARYEVGYRPFRRGSLSEILHLTYADGTVLDLDIRLICDSRDPAPAQSMARAYLGPGGRLYPLRMNRDTTPRLWRAKKKLALAGMERSNRDYETFASLGVAGVFSNMAAGPAAGAAASANPSGAAASGRVVRRTRVVSAAGQKANSAAPSRAAQETPAVPARSQIVRRTDRAALVVRAPKPNGPKPGIHETNGAAWRYQRYRHNASRQGKSEAEILSFETWRRRHFEPTLRGGRPGSPGSPAHQADVLRNNEPNGIKGGKIGNRIPDGVGREGQTLTIRGREIAPRGQGRVIVESDHLIRRGTIPDSAARAQVRDIRKAEPGATIVVTDQANPKAAPLVYPPGKQPPPPGRLPADSPAVVPYP